MTTRGARIVVVRGSVIEQDVDAIVNAANTFMRGGGGVDGAIHDAAGPGLLNELVRVAPNGAAEGAVIVTGAHRLPQRHILHTPGPRWRGGGLGEAETLAACYSGCLAKACELGVRRIAFCSISTGIFGFPLRPAASIAIREARGFAAAHANGPPELIVFAMLGREEYQAFNEALAQSTSVPGC